MDTKEVFYVGKGSKNRYKDMRMRNRYFLNVVNKVGMNNIDIKIIEDNLTENDAFKREIYYIDFYKKQGHNLTNLTKGGEGSSNWFNFLTEEEKEHHRRISASFTNRKHSVETKKKMSESARGRKMSEETKRKISISQAGRLGTTNKTVYIVEFNQIKQIYNSKKECLKNKPKNLSTYFIEKSLKKYKNIEKITDDFVVIFKEDYDRIKTQSTIENTSIGETP